MQFPVKNVKRIIGLCYNYRMIKPTKIFLIDRLLAEGWFDTADEAQPWIIAGKILVDNQRASSGKIKIRADSDIRIKEYYKKKYVNKGGIKLQKALAEFGVDARNRIALDCGAAAGGFTDCLLQHGAKLVYAVDAGHGELAAKLINNEKVRNLERTNISDESLTRLSPKPDLITLDLSYLSLRKAVPVCGGIIAPQGEIVALIKPIVETGENELKRSGDINRREAIADVLTGLCAFFPSCGFTPAGLTYSPIRGNGGALEYFMRLLHTPEDRDVTTTLAQSDKCKRRAEAVIEESFNLENFKKNHIQIVDI